MCREIEEHAEKERERLGIETSASCSLFSMLLNDIWGGKVKKVRRGHRINRKRFYLNVACKQTQVRPCDYDLTVGFEQLTKDDVFILPKGWFKIVDNPYRICFVRPETWEFDNQRIYTEMIMELSAEKKVAYFVKSHSRELNLSSLNVERIIEDLTIHEQAELILNFVNNSKLCLGCRVSEDDSVISTLPHQSGVFKSLSSTEIPLQNGAFSSKCQLFNSSRRKPCLKCTRILRSDKQRKHRRETRKSIDKCCNKRYLTKEEIHLQLKEQRKLNRKNLQENGEGQSSESEDDDSMSQDDSDDEEEKE